MSFRTEEVLSEFGEGASGRREWFDAAGYSFRRLGGFDNSDIDRLAGLVRYRRWAAANREKQRAIGRAYRQRDPEKQRQLGRAKRRRMVASPASHAKRLASWAAYRARKRARQACPKE